MFNRDFYKANGDDWFMPDPNDLVEKKQETLAVDVPVRCSYCGVFAPPQTEMSVTYQRVRFFETTGGISGNFSPWGDWVLIDRHCIKHFTEETPF